MSDISPMSSSRSQNMFHFIGFMSYSKRHFGIALPSQPLLHKVPFSPLRTPVIRALFLQELPSSSKRPKEGELIHIVYTNCGNAKKAEFLTSLKSMHVFAKRALKSTTAFFHIHIISDGTVRRFSERSCNTRNVVELVK